MSKSVIIIGGGVIGLCSAYYCASRGHQVTVIERAPADRDGCSFGNAGMVVPSHFVPLAAPGMVALGLRWMWNPESPFYIKPRLSWDLISWGMRFWRAANASHVRRSAPVLRDLHLASRSCFEELANDLDVDFGLERKGLLMLCRTAHALEEESRGAEVANALGVPAEVLNPAQAERLDPNVRMDITGAVYYPRDCHLSPHHFVSALQRSLEQRGVRFLWETEVSGVNRENGRISAVRTSRGEFEADEIVLAGGVWSSALGRELDLHLPMQAGKGYSLTLPNPRQRPEICSILVEARVAVTPMGNALRVGGTMEMGGLNHRVDERRVKGIIKALPHYYPDIRPEYFEGLQPWHGLRPCSPDGLPYLGRSARYRNVIVATGHAMMGLSLGPISGQLVSQIVSDGTPTIDLTLLSPNRYR